MQELYELILSQLNEIAALRWKDLDAGQLEQENPAVAYPCALIDIAVNNAQDASSKIQHVDYSVKIRLAFNMVGETSAAAPAPVRVDSTSYFNTCAEVYKKLQGLSTHAFDAFSRKSAKPEKRGDGLKVFAIEFLTSGMDVSAANEAVTGWG